MLVHLKTFLKPHYNILAMFLSRYHIARPCHIFQPLALSQKRAIINAWMPSSKTNSFLYLLFMKNPHTYSNTWLAHPAEPIGGPTRYLQYTAYGNSLELQPSISEIKQLYMTSQRRKTHFADEDWIQSKLDRFGANIEAPDAIVR